MFEPFGPRQERKSHMKNNDKKECDTRRVVTVLNLSLSSFYFSRFRSLSNRSLRCVLTHQEIFVCDFDVDWRMATENCYRKNGEKERNKGKGISHRQRLIQDNSDKILCLFSFVCLLLFRRKIRFVYLFRVAVVCHSILAAIRQPTWREKFNAAWNNFWIVCAPRKNGKIKMAKRTRHIFLSSESNRAQTKICFFVLSHCIQLFPVCTEKLWTIKIERSNKVAKAIEQLIFTSILWFYVCFFAVCSFWFFGFDFKIWTQFKLFFFSVPSK